MLIAFYKDSSLDLTLTIISDKIFTFQIVDYFAFALPKTLLVNKYDCRYYISERRDRKSRN